jgi:sugar phosphate isomerase/epimerase
MHYRVMRAAESAGAAGSGFDRIYGMNPHRGVISRRHFLSSSAMVAGAGALTAGQLIGVRAHSGSPAADKEATKGGMKLGLYSITYLGIWYRGAALTLEDVIHRARQFGYDGVELDGKRPHANPLDMPKTRCRELRALAAGNGIELYSVAANNDFSSPIPEAREAQVAYVKELIRMAADLQARTVRLFLAWPGVTKHPQLARYDIARGFWRTLHEPFTPEEVWTWCREGLAECARYAGEAGVVLALQNHAPVIKDHNDVLRMVREVGSPHLKVCLDVPIMPDKSPEIIREAAREVGPLQALSHFGGEYKQEVDGTVHGEAFYAPFIRAMNEIGYRGYIGYELCHPLPVVNGQTVGIEYVDECAKLAAEFMRGLLAGS